MANILVVDDEEPIRALLRAVLERAGHAVMEAPNGRAGLTLYRRQPADLVIMDLLMPDMNGLETIRALTKDFFNVKVIATSGVFTQAGALSTAKQLGARQTLQKPFDLGHLLRSVKYELAH